MKFYYFPVSGYSLKVMMALAEKEIPHEKCIVNPMDPESYKELLEVYPIGKIPYLETDDGQKIPESSIIIEYLDQTHNLGLFPKDPVDCRKARFFDRMCDLYLHNQVGTVFFNGLKPESEQDKDAVKEAKRLLDICYKDLNDHLSGKDFLVGNQFTIADISLFTGLYHAAHAYPFDKYENIKYFHQRIMERPASQKVMEEATPVMEEMMKSLG